MLEIKVCKFSKRYYTTSGGSLAFSDCKSKTLIQPMYRHRKSLVCCSFLPTGAESIAADGLRLHLSLCSKHTPRFVRPTCPLCTSTMPLGRIRMILHGMSSSPWRGTGRSILPIAACCLSVSVLQRCVLCVRCARDKREFFGWRPSPVAALTRSMS